jgi:alpha-L-fucosidase 2
MLGLALSFLIPHGFGQAAPQPTDVSIAVSDEWSARASQRAEPMPAPIVREGGIARWDEGLPLGNGRMGVLVWGEGDTLRLSLDRGDVWDLRPAGPVGTEEWTYATMRALAQAGEHGRHVELFDVPYDTIAHPTKLPGGRVEVVLSEGFRISRLRLDLAAGTVQVDIERPLLDGAKLSQGLVVRLHPSEPVVRVEWLRPRESLRLVIPQGFKQLGYPDAEELSGGDSRRGWQGFEQLTAGGRIALAAAWGVSAPEDPGQPLHDNLAVSLLASEDPATLLPEARALAEGALDSYRNGVEWIPELRPFAPSDRSWVVLPDARLQAQYDLAAYLYRSAAAEGQPPMPLQGLWTADEGGLPPWKGDYHNDLNTQTTYGAYLTAGLWPQGQTWLDFNWRLLPRYRRFAQEFYGLGAGTAAIPGVMALNGDPLGGWGQYSLSPTNGAWIAWQFALHQRYARDPLFLRERAVPFCFEVGAALLALLEPVAEEQAFLRLPLSTSPEIHDNSPAAWLEPNSNYDQALLMALFAANRDLARELGNGAEAERWAAALARLEPLDVDPQTGSLTFARGEPYRESHRHFSHAMAIHPLGLISIEGDAAERALVKATLDTIEAHGTQSWVGYSFAWFAAMNARAGRGERARALLEDYLCFVGPNGFHLNGEQCGRGLSAFRYRPFTLEGNFLAMDAVHEMLLQSWGGRLRIFPALPDAWPKVEFHGLRAEGGWSVSARREAGRTTGVQIKASTGGPLLLADPFGLDAEGQELGRFDPEALAREGGLLRFELPPGGLLTGLRRAP